MYVGDSRLGEIFSNKFMYIHTYVHSRPKNQNYSFLFPLKHINSTYVCVYIYVSCTYYSILIWGLYNALCSLCYNVIMDVMLYTAQRHTCCRCGKPFIIYNSGSYQSTEECCYHYKKLQKKKSTYIHTVYYLSQYL